jgi:hydrogenase maturation factor
MFALQLAPPSKMYIRALDGLMTSNKSSAKLFDSVQQAENYYNNWLTITEVQGTEHFNIVEVEVKKVITKQIKVVKEI